MSLDVYLTATRPTEVYSANITHNLVDMAAAVDLYKPLWRPEEIGVTTAAQLIPLLRLGEMRLVNEEDRLLPLNPENGWGDYEGLLWFVRAYLDACEANPDATIRVSR